jgi:hypothetical protein
MKISSGFVLLGKWHYEIVGWIWDFAEATRDLVAKSSRLQCDKIWDCEEYNQKQK